MLNTQAINFESMRVFKIYRSFWRSLTTAPPCGSQQLPYADTISENSTTMWTRYFHEHFNGVVEFLFIIAVYLRIKDYSGMNIKNSTMLHTVVFNVFSNGNQSDNI